MCYSTDDCAGSSESIPGNLVDLSNAPNGVQQVGCQVVYGGRSWKRLIAGALNGDCIKSDPTPNCSCVGGGNLPNCAGCILDLPKEKCFTNSDCTGGFANSLLDPNFVDFVLGGPSSTRVESCEFLFESASWQESDTSACINFSTTRTLCSCNGAGLQCPKCGVSG